MWDIFPLEKMWRNATKRYLLSFPVRINASLWESTLFSWEQPLRWSHLARILIAQIKMLNFCGLPALPVTASRVIKPRIKNFKWQKHRQAQVWLLDQGCYKENCVESQQGCIHFDRDWMSPVYTQWAANIGELNISDFRSGMTVLLLCHRQPGGVKVTLLISIFQQW